MPNPPRKTVAAPRIARKPKQPANAAGAMPHAASVPAGLAPAGANPLVQTPSDSGYATFCAALFQPVGHARRNTRSGGAASFDAQDFATAQLLEVQFADGSVYYTHPQDFAAEQGLDVATRSGQAPGRMQLPFDLSPGVGAPRSAEAGSSAAQVDHYRLARLTAPTALDTVYDMGQRLADAVGGWLRTPNAQAADAIAQQLCRAFENSLLHPALPKVDGASGGLLLLWDTTSGSWQPAQGATLPDHADALLLLHGTASSTRGSFSGLWEAAEGAGRGGSVPADFARLAQTRVLLAYDHRSLTVSPLHNALDVLQQLEALQLPAGCRLSLLSHSRGGLVGDLVSVALGSELGADDRQRLAAVLSGAYPDDHADRASVVTFGALLQRLGGRWAAGSFVRVACPARGTLLADRRTDLFLSLLLRSLGLAVGGVGNPWFEALQGLVRALVATRAKASVLPGLEAMIPGKPLSRALNVPLGTLVLPGRLRVVAGDSKSLGWGGVLTLLGDVFYGLHDHDFVVHTHSMFGGFPRRDAQSLRVEDKSVTHFGYFKPGSLTRKPVLEALSGTDTGWHALAEDEARTRGLLQVFKNRHARRTAQDWVRRMEASTLRKPILVVLPGIMGSELARDTGLGTEQTPVWLSLQTLLGGDLARLQLRADAPLVPSGVMAVAYERLLEQASSRYHVVAMPYDWRQPLQVAGDQLYTLLARQLLPAALRMGKPLHILAHSMGGLVARAALFWNGPGVATPQQRAALWTAIGRNEGRLLMLGTPNQGSYAPVQLLLQQHQTASLVATAAAGVSGKDLARYGAAFPGLMAMLPADADTSFGDLFDAASWAGMPDADSTLTLPDPTVLVGARQVRQWLSESFDALKQDPRVLYVAGQGATPLGLHRVPGRWGGEVLRLGVTPEGDGTVPWNSALLPERTWFVASSHGDLPDRTSAFAGYFELLEQGSTAQLSRQRPATRGMVRQGALLRLPELPSLPADPAGYVLGVSGSAGDRWTPPIEVRVVHGSLDYARYPLMVGHYYNDSLMGAVQRVNMKLGGQLQRMVDLKLFVGAARTAAYLRPPTTDVSEPAYPGAVVLGLGVVGELTPATLAQTVTRGVLRYAFEHAYQDAWVPREGPLELRLSTLLIGTHVQAVGVRDSLASVLQGLWRASEMLADDKKLARSVRVAEVEVVEIDENTALDAAYQLSRLLARSEWAPRFTWSPATLESRDGGQRGFRPSASDSIWQHLCVAQDDSGAMRFELIAERARVESTRVHAAVSSLSDYIARVSDAGAAGGGDAEEQASLGGVLYQLLLPQALKSRLLNFEQTVLVLDDASAALPWELLTPPMAESIGNDAPVPLAVQAGMVRQRMTTDFRGLPGVPSALDALVIGAPLTDGWTNERGEPLQFAPLPGAEQEARRVATLLADHQWTVKPLPVGSSFERVRTALYERPWRVLHLCGHGVVDQFVGTQGERKLPLRRTGMVLNRQQVLSAGDVDQMDPCPEFVFINCCYSGRDSASPDVQRNAPVLAASLALQFIRMGAKAVVAAGWQVDDADGLTFANELYCRLLDGETFGDAVRDARRAVYTQGGANGPRSNTWGAYQCYGDHQWRLVQPTQASAGASSGPLGDAHRCMSKHELAARILQVVAIAGDMPAAQLEQQLDALIDTLRADAERQEWLRSSRVRAALGEAYRELGAHLKAVTWLQRAAKTAYSRLELRHLEMGINSLSRLRPEDQDPANPHACHTMAKQLLNVLAGLDQLDASGLRIEPENEAEYAASSESERLCLEGSNHMRQAAAVQNPTTRAGLLFEAAKFYRRSYISKVDRSDLPERRAFALSCALVCAGLAVLSGAAPFASRMQRLLRRPLRQPVDWEAATQTMLEEMARAGLSATFWHYTNSMDLLVARQVLAVALDEDAPQDDQAQVLNLLDRALVRWPSPVEVDSMQHRWTLTIAVLKAAADPPPAQAQRRQSLIETLQRAIDKLDRLRPGDTSAL